jgi:hypothetical protein
MVHDRAPRIRLRLRGDPEMKPESNLMQRVDESWAWGYIDFPVIWSHF